MTVFHVPLIHLTPESNTYKQESNHSKHFSEKTSSKTTTTNNDKMRREETEWNDENGSSPCNKSNERIQIQSLG